MRLEVGGRDRLGKQAAQEGKVGARVVRRRLPAARRRRIRLLGSGLGLGSGSGCGTGL